MSAFSFTWDFGVGGKGFFTLDPGWKAAPISPFIKEAGSRHRAS